MKLLLLIFALKLAAWGGDETTTAQALRHYCKACHGIGKYRFIYSDDDGELLQYIRTHNAPSGRRWVDAVTASLDWPSDDPPPFDQPGWMPKGEKRLEMAADTVNGTPVRRVILDTLLEIPD